MAEQIAFENKRIFNSEGLVTLILTLNRVTLHNVVHHSSTSTSTTYRRTDGRTFETHFIRSTTQKSRPKNLFLIDHSLLPKQSKSYAVNEFHVHVLRCHHSIIQRGERCIPEVLMSKMVLRRRGKQ